MIDYKISEDPIPVILIKNFLIPTEEDRSNILNNIFNAKKKYDEIEGKKEFYSYMIEEDYNLFLNKLYKQFILSCFKIFGNLKISEKNTSSCWGYCSNAIDYSSYWHDHKRTSTINAVYYINIPQSSKGPLYFRVPKNNNQFEIFSYHPENYDLIIFPNYLEHKPIPPLTEEYRVCINMEIICDNITSKNIFKKVFPYLFVD